MIHFVYLATQLWKKGWHVYNEPLKRLEFWDGILLNVFISAGMGEYIESTARVESGCGFYDCVSLISVRDVLIVVDDI